MNRPLHRRLLPACLIAGIALFRGHTAVADEIVSAEAAQFFETHIRPALVENCLDCHSAETEASGNLLLDSREGWEAGGDFGPAIRPGDSAGSLLMKVIRYEDPELQMPPDGKLDQRTINLFQKWIDQGALDPRRSDAAGSKESTGLTVDRAQEHWAYRPLQSVALEATSGAAGPIDSLIDAKLADQGLEPASCADDLQLLRRLSFDLTGLPPTLQQIESVSNGMDAQAWERLTESMLASPAYAERFARHWMDVARYAESITLRGFVLPQAWRYRDYLIRAYAKDRGFDRMIMDQIAGDLAGGKTLGDRQLAAVATGFLAMGNTNLEDQDKTNLDFDHIDEQLETIGRAFLGQTIGCARCHDHKFDPIPTADYYAMAGIMRSTVAMEHANVSKWIEHPLPLSPETEAEFIALELDEKQITRQIKTLKDTLKPAARKQKSYPPDAFAGVVVDDDEAKFIGSWKSSSSVGGYVADGYRHDSDEDQGKKTATFEAFGLSAGDYEVRISYTASHNRATNVQVRVFSANEAQTVVVNQRKAPSIEGIWTSLGTFPFEKDGQAFVMVSNEDADGHVIVDAVQFLPIAEQQAPKVNDNETANEDGLERLETLEARLADVREQLEERPVYLTVAEGEPKDAIPIRIRGIVQHHGPAVPRGFLTAIGQAETWASRIDRSGSGRLQMARWLADAENPLTARVYANRVWSWLMGEGLVATENNFGTTGESPSHPLLLDWLATELISSNWSTKHLVRQIVRSDAYRRRVVAADPKASRLDPDNRLYWTANLKRLPVEALRDAMLVASGELDPRPFGSSIRPSVKADYNFQHNSLRRSVYQPVFRNSLPPLYGVFDFADTSVSVGQRSRSTVATQSLVMMNHSWVIERAEAAAERLSTSCDGDNPKDLIDRAYRVCLGRPPGPVERRMSLEYLDDGGRLADLVHSLFASLDFRYLE